MELNEWRLIDTALGLDLDMCMGTGGGCKDGYVYRNELSKNGSVLIGCNGDDYLIEFRDSTESQIENMWWLMHNFGGTASWDGESTRWKSTFGLGDPEVFDKIRKMMHRCLTHVLKGDK